MLVLRCLEKFLLWIVIKLQVKGALEDIMDKLPERFPVAEMMAKVEDKTPYIIVAFQECERMNILTSEMKRSLHELDLGNSFKCSPKQIETVLWSFLARRFERWTHNNFRHGNFGPGYIYGPSTRSLGRQSLSQFASLRTVGGRPNPKDKGARRMGLRFLHAVDRLVGRLFQSPVVLDGHHAADC